MHKLCQWKAGQKRSVPSVAPTFITPSLFTFSFSISLCLPHYILLIFNLSRLLSQRRFDAVVVAAAAAPEQQLAPCQCLNQMERREGEVREDAVSRVITSLSPRFSRWNCVAGAGALASSATAAAGAEGSRDGDGWQQSYRGPLDFGCCRERDPFAYPSPFICGCPLSLSLSVLHQMTRRKSSFAFPPVAVPTIARCLPLPATLLVGHGRAMEQYSSIVST